MNVHTHACAWNDNEQNVHDTFGLAASSALRTTLRIPE